MLHASEGAKCLNLCLWLFANNCCSEVLESYVGGDL